MADRSPTLDDIAQLCGLSRSSVSRALNNHPSIPAATRERVLKVAQKLGHQRSAALSDAMRSVRTRGKQAYRETIACLTNEIPLDQHPEGQSSTCQCREFLAGLKERAEEMGCELDFLAVSQVGHEKMAGILEARGIRRVIFIGPSHTPRQGSPAVPIWTRFPTVFLSVQTSDWISGAVVRPDYFAAGRKAFIEGWKAGYRKFAINHLIGILNADRRFEAGVRFAGECVQTGQSIDITTLPLRNEKNLLEILDQVSPDTCVIGGIPPRVYPDLMKTLREPDRPAWIDWHANLYRSNFALAGIDQQDRQQAREAVTLCLGMDPLVGPDIKTASATYQVSPKWIDGETLPQLGNTSLNMEPESPYPLTAGSRFTHVTLPNSHREQTFPHPAWSRFQNVPPIPSGRWIFHGVPFELDPGPFAGIVLNSADTSRPAPSLRIRRKARAIYFLHVCSFPLHAGEVARYIITFQGAKKQRELPLNSLGDSHDVRAMPKDQALPPEVNVQDWWPGNRHFHNQGARSVCLLDMEQRPGLTGYVYILEWINPRPGAVIESIELRPGQDPEAALLLCAITLAK